MLHSLFMLAALVGGMSMPLAIDNANQIEEKVEFKQENKRLVSYNDETYRITLSADEVNNYTWENLYNLSFTYYVYLEDYIDFSYDSSTYIIVAPLVDGDSVYWREDLQGTGAIYLIGDSTEFNAGEGDEVAPYDYCFLYSDAGVYSLFESDLVFLCTDEYYADIKQAIELDIQANQNTQPQMMPVLEEIVSLLTGGIIGISTGLGGGVSDLVSSIFLNNGALSVFGAIIAVFAGISLAIGLSRWVMNFLTSLGAKK